MSYFKFQGLNNSQPSEDFFCDVKLAERLSDDQVSPDPLLALLQEEEQEITLAEERVFYSHLS